MHSECVRRMVLYRAQLLVNFGMDELNGVTIILFGLLGLSGGKVSTKQMKMQDEYDDEEDGAAASNANFRPPHKLTHSDFLAPKSLQHNVGKEPSMSCWQMILVPQRN